MLRTHGVSALFIVALVSLGLSAHAQTPPAAKPAAVEPASPENAAAFIGDWTLTGEGSNGPANFTLSIKVDAAKKVAAEITMQQGPQAITEISRVGTGLVLRYSFDYQGSDVPVVLTLTPNGDKVTMQMDFANGAYQINGAATKKVK